MLHAIKHDTIIQEAFLWLFVVRFWNCILKESVKEELVLALGIPGIQFSDVVQRAK